MGPRTVTAGILAICSLAACSGGSSPEGVAREWTEAMTGMDGNKAASLTCDAMQGDLQMGGALLSVTQIFASDLIGQRADIDLSGLEYRVVSQSGDQATVHVSGTMRTAILGVSRGKEMDSDVYLVREDGKWLVCS